MVADLKKRFSNAEGWWLLLEYEIPRRSKRPDVIILADDLIFVIEFKIGINHFVSNDLGQVRDYALDLSDFHRESHGRSIIPILVATETNTKTVIKLVEGIEVRCTSAHGLVDLLHKEYESNHTPITTPINALAWEKSPYRPTPTIIEAAESLFAGHDVKNISHSFATNLNETSRSIVETIQRSQHRRERNICFITGVPGAGKTLAGLNAVHDPILRQEGRPTGIFLSGNGPLVRIIREALARDQHKRGISKKKEAIRRCRTFIDNVHRFLNHYAIDSPDDVPYENVIVFDEAQRAWSRDQVLKKHTGYDSEPTMILDIMERTQDWCTVIALVGGGQEIHDGEIGLEEWGNALNKRSVNWRVVVSPEVIQGGAAVAGHRLFRAEPKPHLTTIDTESMHLSVSTRSPRACWLTNWVNAVLDQKDARSVLPDLKGVTFPVVITRSQKVLRDWLRDRARDERRSGLIASSGALRLRAHGIEISSGFRRAFSYVDWFLSSESDHRCSSRLEVAATEFDCQGLELDWTGICWGGDFTIDPDNDQWSCRALRGSKWQHVRKEQTRRFILNKYRVLLTRAREGMIIWIPLGDASDPTRDCHRLNATAEYLESCGVPRI